MRPLLLVTLSPAAHHTTTRLLMSADIREDGGGGGAIGATERLLLAAKRQRELGLRQEYGTTVKKDGLDGVRAAVWALFGVSQVVFTVLGVALTLGLALNMLGYGYYFENGNFVVDGIDHIRQQQLFQVEANNLAVYEAVEQATTSGLPQ